MLRKQVRIFAFYLFCNGNARLVIRYPNRKIPNRSVFTRFHRYLSENGNFNKTIAIGRPRVRVEGEEVVPA